MTALLCPLPPAAVQCVQTIGVCPTQVSLLLFALSCSSFAGWMMTPKVTWGAPAVKMAEPPISWVPERLQWNEPTPGSRGMEANYLLSLRCGVPLVQILEFGTSVTSWI